MTHDQAVHGDTVEAYTRGRLTTPDQLEFEEHFFACAECFAEVQNAQRFKDGVKHAAETGLLPPFRAQPVSWWRPAFIFSAAAACGLIAVTAWMGLAVIPRLRLEAQTFRDNAEQQHRRAAGLESQLAENLMALNRPPEARANLPLVMLEASRAADGATLTLPAGATEAAIWMEADSASPFVTFRLELSRAGAVVASVEGLKKNPYGALAATIPAVKLPAGSYRAKLYGMGSKPALAAEYQFDVQR